MDVWPCNKSPWSYSRYLVGLTFVRLSFRTKLAKENRPIMYIRIYVQHRFFISLKNKISNESNKQITITLITTCWVEFLILFYQFFVKLLSSFKTVNLIEIIKLILDFERNWEENSVVKIVSRKRIALKLILYRLIHTV